MDPKSFGDPLFDPITYVNKTLSKFNHDENKEQAVTSLLVKLQLYFQQLNGELEGSCQNVMQNLPRVVHDIDNLTEEALVLKQKMNNVKQEIAKVELSAGTSIASLEKIDGTKTMLVKAKQALYEADNWTVLSTDIEAVFETGDIDVIASKLVSMQQSLSVLSTSADYENKKIQLEGLKNRLEAMASPFVVEAFTNKSTDQSKRFVKIFQDIGRLPLLVKYYSKCQKASLLQKWQSLVDLDAEDNVYDSLQSYYELLLSNWQEQINWCAEIIPQISPTIVLLELYTDLLISISHQFYKAFDENVKQSSEPLKVLLQFKQCSKMFANNLKLKLIDFDISYQQQLTIAKAVYMPYIQHISKYGSVQKELFQQQLATIVKDEEFMDTVQTLGQKNSHIFASANEGQKMCMDLTDGGGFPGFLTALESFFNNFLKVYQTVAANIREQKSGQTDLNMFQVCITVLQNLGEFIVRLKQVDQECVQDILHCNVMLKKSETDPFNAFSNLVMDAERRRELDALFSDISTTTEPQCLKSCYTAVENVCRNVYQTCFQVIFAPISLLLESFVSAPAWKNRTVSSDLPDYSYTPHEYITQIGQYLMNLPQLLEPFLSMDNPSLNLALSIVGVEYVQLLNDEAENSGFAEIFLGRITDATCRVYSDQILSIDSLGGSACKQLVTDINYLGNVLEDLGFTLSDRLKNIMILLKLSPAEYSSQNLVSSPQLVAAVRQMRNIISE